MSAAADAGAPVDAPFGVRFCAFCGAAEPVGAGEPVWPPGRACPACGESPPHAEGVALHAPHLADTRAGFDPATFATLAALEHRHFWFVPRNRLLVGLVDRFFPGARSLMEIGCGTGAVLAALAARRSWERLVGADLHPEGLRRARARVGPPAEFAQFDATVIPGAGLFDVICAFDVVEHIADDEAALGAVHRALRPGGGAVVSVPQHPALWSRADELAHHARRYRRGELEGKLRRAGFEVLYSTSYCALLLPLMAASRWLGRRKGKGDEAAALEFNPSGAANATLRALLELEVRASLAGLRLPVGGSRVVVARRSAGER